MAWADSTEGSDAGSSRGSDVPAFGTPCTGWAEKLSKGDATAQMHWEPEVLEAVRFHHYNEMDSEEIQGLAQELVYHTDLSTKQLHELQERISTSAQVLPVQATEALTDSERLAALQAVLSEYNLPVSPHELRSALAARQMGSPRSHFDSPFSNVRSTPLSALTRSPCISSQATPMAATPEIERSSPSSWKLRNSHGHRSRLTLRLQISQFLTDPQKRLKIMTLWRHEASRMPAVISAGSCFTTSRHADRWYRRIYSAYETTLSNLLDENDTSIREVLIDFVLREVRRAASPVAKRVSLGSTRSTDDHESRPPRFEAMRRVVLSFTDVVLNVRSSTAGSTEPEFRQQWADCLSGVGSRFEQALDSAWKSLWLGGAEQPRGETSPMETLRGALRCNSRNSFLLSSAAQEIAINAGEWDGNSANNAERFRGACLRQAIKVSRSFLQVAREMTLMVGLWSSGYGIEGDHLSQAVLREEYRRVRQAFAEMLFRRSRDILDTWSGRLHKETPMYAEFLTQHRERHVSKSLLNAVIEWWRTGQSGLLRTACMDLVSLHWAVATVHDNGDDTKLQLEDIEAAIIIFEEIVLGILDHEIVVGSQATVPPELSLVDVPRCRDILSRLVNELGRHVEGEWRIAEIAQSSTLCILPEPELFQVSPWKRSMPFDLAVPKTAFLGTEVVGRFVVTRYVNRGAMGRVWVLEDKLGLESMPLCLKTFYCERECEDMSNLTVREFKRCVLEELSQVERWLTSRTRLATSVHIVRVLRVLRDAPVLQVSGGKRVDGTINGIIMEFCDRGELTSYLWDDKEHRPRAFDQPMAKYIFAQLTELVSELMAPTDSPPMVAPDALSFRFNVCKSAENPPTPSNRLQRSSSAATDFSNFGFDFESDGGYGGYVRYFHNDIKTENLVVSGTTLKLIDFQSLTPLRRSRAAQRPQLEHATVIYQHRNPTAMRKGFEGGAESTIIWAVGVILVRLLAADLPTDWVYRNRGLGTQTKLEEMLPQKHCLLDRSPGGPRELLDLIFSPEITPTNSDVIAHPWLKDCLVSELTPLAEATFFEIAQRSSLTSGALNAWIPLSGCLNVEGQPAPLKRVADIVEVAVSLSDGRFRVDGRRQRTDSSLGDFFTEWHVTVCAGEEDEETHMPPVRGRPVSPMSMDPTPSTCRSAAITDPEVRSPQDASQLFVQGRESLKRHSLWQELRSKLVVDHFYIQVRVKDDIEEGEPSDIWWLRLKWVPPMVTGKRESLASFAPRADGGSNYSTCSFVQLQQLILEARNEVDQRLARAHAELSAPRKKMASSLLLPIPVR